MNAAVDDADRGGLVRSSAAVAAGTFVSRITGLIRVIALAAVLGKATLADTYNLANTLPNIIYELLVGGVLAATLVPVFVRLLQDRDTRSTSAIFTVTLTALAAFTGIALLAAPLIARLFAIDTSGAERAAQLHVLTVLIACFVPQMLFYGFTTLATALLNAHRRFVAAAFAPALNNIVVTGILVVFAAVTSGRAGNFSDATRVRSDLGLLLLLGIGTTAGIAVVAVTLGVVMLRGGIRIRPVFAWRDPAVRTIARLSGWTLGYVACNQIAQLFVLVLAKSGEVGAVSAYVYAFTFYVVPHGLIAVSIMTTMNPELARRAADGDLVGLRRDFGVGLRYILVLMVPASVLFAILAQPMLGVIVRNQFSASDAATTADVLQLFALSLVPFSLYLYAMRGFYAMHDTRTPFFLNLFENALNIGLALALFPALGPQGLAIAWGIAYFVAAVAALVALGHRIGTVFDRPERAATTRSLISVIALAIVAAPLAGAIGNTTVARAFVATVLAGAAASVVYVLAMWALRADELGSLVDMVRRRRVAGRSV